MDVDGYRPGQVSWVDLVTTDPEGAREFYRALFSWAYDIGPAETGHYTICLLDGRKVAGMNGDPSDRVPPSWTTYFATGDVERDADRIAALGGDAMMGPLDIPGQGGVWVGSDPTGAVFGLWEPRGHGGAERRDEPGSLVWHELATRDLDAALDFYRGLFGYAVEDVDTGEGGPPYRAVAVDGTTVAGLMAMDATWPPAIRAHWMPYFGVADADAAGTTAERQGGTVSVPPSTTPFGRFTVLEDPQGAVFTVMDGSTRA